MNSSASNKTAPNPERLGRNHGRYGGETIDIATVLEECIQAADSDWRHERISAADEVSLEMLRLAQPGARKRIYLSAGIHGDEPAGPLAVRELMRKKCWRKDVDVWLCPCLNPTGFPLNRRESAAGLDLNREYHAPTALETVAHVAWLKLQPDFDTSICLHEDWEAQGFYLYELNLSGRPSPAEAIIERVENVCPIDYSEIIEGRAARGGIVRPNADPLSRPQWPEAFYLLQNHTRHSYTLEAPSDFPLATRVEALVIAVQTIIESL